MTFNVRNPCREQGSAGQQNGVRLLRQVEASLTTLDNVATRTVASVMTGQAATGERSLAHAWKLLVHIILLSGFMLTKEGDCLKKNQYDLCYIMFMCCCWNEVHFVMSWKGNLNCLSPAKEKKWRSEGTVLTTYVFDLSAHSSHIHKSTYVGHIMYVPQCTYMLNIFQIHILFHISCVYFSTILLYFLLCFYIFLDIHVHEKHLAH